MAPKILIVDDEPHIRLLLARILEDLEDAGVDLLIANNGADALQIIKAEIPELVFLDVMMPQMDGIQVCQIIKHELGLKNVHVVMLTARGQELDREKARAAGADSYVTKPFDPDEMLEKAQEILGL